MSEKPLTFSEWINFEADRIVSMGCTSPQEHQADYMRVQIVQLYTKRWRMAGMDCRTMTRLVRSGEIQTGRFFS